MNSQFDCHPQSIELPGEEPVRLNFRCGPPNGPPILLLHGHPQNHLMWNKVWPKLSDQYELIAPDLRGYGDSSKPKGAADHSNYSKRVMASDLVSLMTKLGHKTFFVLAHDRGARVAHRLGVDHPEAVRAMVLLDIAPTLAMYTKTSEPFARAYWHWFFLIQPYPVPETLLASKGASYVLSVLGGRYAGLAPFEKNVLDDYIRCADNESTIHAICEDYRASASIDLKHDRHDKESKTKLSCPVLVMCGQHGAVAKCFDVKEEWAQVATVSEYCEIDCGHYLAEEAPNEVCRRAMEFFVQW